MQQHPHRSLPVGLGCLSLLMAPSAQAGCYLVNGHRATVGEAQLLASYGGYRNG